jgi:hypothetical protein
MQWGVEIRIKIKIETSFKLCSNTTLLISGATAGLVYARNGPLQQVNFLACHQIHGRSEYFSGQRGSASCTCSLYGKMFKPLPAKQLRSLYGTS